MERRPLGRLGLTVPVVGMGTWKTFDVRGSSDEMARRDVVDAMLAGGGNLFDSSPMYGEAERVLAKSLEGRRDQALVATKVWTSDDREAERQMANALSWYGGVVDVYQVHNLVAWERRLLQLEALKAEGKVRAVGATHYLHGSLPDLMEVMRTGRLDMVQVPYNAGDRTVERELLPLAEELGLGVLVMKPLGTGRLLAAPRGFDPARYEPYGVSTWAQVLLKWILSDPRVSAVIPATARPAHARDNCVAGDPPWFEASERERIARLLQA
ncbi:MAG TPA: aldo/keto reductase [Candidatus Thermoplasmatota archaeon]|nr:aldo/keto reductase [Candidatus Thermoplasmatota archaeon]